MRIKFLKAESDAHGGYVEPGQIIDMGEAPALAYIKRGMAVEVDPTVCPQCGYRIEELQGPPGAPESMESATVAHNPRRR
jgi:hypothetical protein